MNALSQSTIMVVDDEVEIRRLIERYLSREGFQVDTCADGAEMWERLEESQPDLVILDIRLPGDDGLSLTRQLHQNVDTAIILLTSRSEVIDRVAGLESGADDYLSKPFDPRELLARINAVLRRFRKSNSNQATLPEDEEYGFDGWFLSITRRELLNAQQTPVPLSPAEFDLLHVLVKFPNRVLSRDFLMEKTYGRNTLPYDRSIDVRIGHLRRKLGQTQDSEKPIKTVRGSGYLFSATVNLLTA